MFMRLLVLAVLTVSCASAKSNASKPFVDRLEYVGVVLDRADYYTWGTSVVKGKDGKYHLYACQWNTRHGFGAWSRESEVNYFVGKKPEGPYSFVKTIVSARPGGDVEGVWNRYTAHNPEVKRIGNKYVLTYISYETPRGGVGRIGMKCSNSPKGPWVDVGEKGMVMERSEVADMPSYKSHRGTDNPSLIKYHNKYYLFFMYNPGPNDRTSLGVAVSDKLEGPYIEQSVPVLLAPEGKKVEDLCVYLDQGQICAVMCDNFGMLVNDGGIYCEMNQKHFKKTDEVIFDIHSVAWRSLPKMVPEQDFSKGKHVYGPKKFERPKILTINGVPSYMFLPSGFNAKGDNWTVLHGFKIKRARGNP